MLLPIVVAALAGLAYWQKPWKRLTPEKRAAYENAMRELRDAPKLRTLAEAYAKQGFKKEAEMLTRRAKCLELPPEVKAARRAAFEKAMASTNADQIESMAKAFEQQGQTLTAATLRNYAKQIKAAECAQEAPAAAPSA